MMFERVSDGVLAVAAGAVLGAVIGCAAYWFDAASCEARWVRSGMAWDYGLFQGCVVEVRPGVWVPDNRVREIEPGQ